MRDLVRIRRKSSDPRCGSQVWDEKPGISRADLSESAETLAPYHRWSGLLSRTIALVLLVAVLPVILLAIALVRLSSRGPVFYRQTRMGLRGKTFHIYKIRTMIVDAEASTGPIWASENDPRVTRVGRLLRRLNWDELPQLFNVVKGDMAFVGPRPERPEIAQRITAEIPEYAQRTLVRPGMTGLAQLNLPADVDLDSVRKKLQLDLDYIERAGLSLDVRIIASTIPRVAGLRSSRVTRFFRVYRRPRLPIWESPVAKHSASRRRSSRAKRKRRAVLPPR